jgi:hypothetical protein
MTQGEPDKGPTQGLGEGKGWEISTEVCLLPRPRGLPQPAAGPSKAVSALE